MHGGDQISHPVSGPELSLWGQFRESPGSGESARPFGLSSRNSSDICRWCDSGRFRETKARCREVNGCGKLESVAELGHWRSGNRLDRWRISVDDIGAVNNALNWKHATFGEGRAGDKESSSGDEFGSNRGQNVMHCNSSPTPIAKNEQPCGPPPASRSEGCSIQLFMSDSSARCFCRNGNLDGLEVARRQPDLHGLTRTEFPAFQFNPADPQRSPAVPGASATSC